MKLEGLRDERAERHRQLRLPSQQNTQKQTAAKSIQYYIILIISCFMEKILIKPLVNGHIMWPSLDIHLLRPVKSPHPNTPG